MRNAVCACAIVLAALSLARAAERPASPLEPLAAQETLQVAAGLRVELVACEPQVVDPVEARFDELGRLWVVEMRDYPEGPAEGQPPQSRIVVLVDRDRDGFYESSHVFADALVFPTGLQPWAGGVFVTLSGEIAYLADRDNDGRADERTTWFVGFSETNTQLRANHPRLGLDGRIYVANGLRDGQVRDAQNPSAAPLELRGRDFAFDPRTRALEAVTGYGQFGLTFDDYGRRFVCSNRNPFVHAVLESRYATRNPLLAVPNVVADVAASGETSRVYPLSSAWTTSNLHAGQFTAACGAHVYRGDLLPEPWRGAALTCDPTGSLVHAERMQPAGATFTGESLTPGGELLASPDDWFRPVNLETGPDGALYVVDMYRAVIEHPEWVPDELKRRPDQRWGDDRGRIWRIVPAERGERPPAAALARATSQGLVELLGDANGWTRDVAARLLLERGDLSVVPDLEKLAQHAVPPQARVHALWLLANLGALSRVTIARALADESPRVVEQAVLLAETRLAADDFRTLTPELLSAAGSDDPRVRFQLLLSLGGLPASAWEETRFRRAFGRLALTSAADPWSRIAAASAASTGPQILLGEVLAEAAGQGWPAAGAELARELAQLAGSANDPALTEAVLDVLHGLPEEPAAGSYRAAGVFGLAQGLRGRGIRLESWLSAHSPERAARLLPLWTSLAAHAEDVALDVGERVAAVAQLAAAPTEIAVPALDRLWQTGGPLELRLAVVAALDQQPDERVGPLLAADLAAQSPVVRRAVFDALIPGAARAACLLAEIQAGRLAPLDLDPVRAEQLRTHSDEAVRRAARELLAVAAPADREHVLTEYRAALELPSDPLRGRVVFEKNCATCHRIGELGVDVGPAISDTRTKTAEQLLLDILHPNRAIDANFVAYALTTADGQAHTGIIIADTGTSLTLRIPEGKNLTLLRDEIDELRSTGLSLMPVGLERNVSQQAMADLLDFLKNWRYLENPIGE